MILPEDWPGKEIAPMFFGPVEMEGKIYCVRLIVRRATLSPFQHCLMQFPTNVKGHGEVGIYPRGT